MTLPKAIIPPIIPYDLNAKIFRIPCEHEEEGILCDCIPEYESLNDRIKFMTDISGINPELMGSTECKKP